MPITDRDILPQSNFTDHETEDIEKVALEKKFRVLSFKEYYALSPLEYCFLFKKNSAYPKLNNDLELLKIETKDEDIKNSKYRSEKNDHEKILKSPKVDNDY